MKNIAILGPTGSGKTSISIEVAKKLNGEIISCDSMQIYRGMPIGTAQPTAEERSQVPYHLVDFLDISEPYDASKFVAMANEAIDEMKSRGKQPIIAGGTGLYASFLIHGHDDFPSDKALSKQLLARYQNGEIAALESELRSLDEESYQRTRHNWRRLLRALEICLITGEKIVQPKTVKESNEFTQFLLLYSPEKLRERIAMRTREMIQEGWVEEAAELFKGGLMETSTARQALGYSIIHEYLFPTPKAANEIHLAINTEEELIDRLVIKTAQYAKKQRTWFRNRHPEAIVVDMDKFTKAEAVEFICQQLENLK